MSPPSASTVAATLVPRTLTTVVPFVALVIGCHRSPDADGKPAPARSSDTQAPSPAVATAAAAPHAGRSFPVPTGPILAIFAGQGLGPIRFGATRATVERHMEAPCDVVTETMCRYIGRAAEFTFDNGVVSGIRVHRIDRPTQDKDGEAVRYGAFNGGIPPDLRMGMLPWAIEEKLGKAQRVEKKTVPAYGTEEVHYYDGLVVEYDRMPNGKLVMGGVTVVKTNATVGPR